MPLEKVTEITENENWGHIEKEEEVNINLCNVERYSIFMVGCRNWLTSKISIFNKLEIQ